MKKVKRVNDWVAGKMAMQRLMLDKIYQKHPEWKDKSFGEILDLIPPRNKENPLFKGAIPSFSGIIIEEGR